MCIMPRKNRHFATSRPLPNSLHLNSCDISATFYTIMSAKLLKGRLKKKIRHKKTRNLALMEPETVGRTILHGRWRSVKVYARLTPSGNTSYMVSNWAEGKKRRFDSYPTYDAAKDAAKRLCERMGKQEIQAAMLPETDAAAYVRCKEKLGKLGVVVHGEPLSVETAIDKMVDLLHEVSFGELLDACRVFKSQKQNVTPKMLPEAVNEFIVQKKRENYSELYRIDLKSRLGRFAEDFKQHIHNVSASQISSWIHNLRLSRASMRNYRRVLHTFFEYAKSLGFCTSNPVVESARVRSLNASEVKVFSPDELVRLLNAAEDDLIPVLVIGAFAGLRTEEVRRLRWEEVDFEHDLIHVGAKKAKTRSRRLVPLLPNLKAWLRSIPGVKRGRVWKGDYRGELYYREMMCAKATGEGKLKPVPWRHNGLRHSFCTYRLSVIKNEAQVAFEAGNSPAMIYRHYRALVPQTEGEKWFNIYPPGKAENIVNMPAKAAV